MRLTRRALPVVVLLAALAAITIWGPGWLIAVVWGIVALALMGAGMNRSPSIQARARVQERRVKRP
jgi:hypothetical protein